MKTAKTLSFSTLSCKPDHLFCLAKHEGKPDRKFEKIRSVSLTISRPLQYVLHLSGKGTIIRTFAENRQCSTWNTEKQMFHVEHRKITRLSEL